MTADPFEIEISRRIWDAKYRFREAGAVRDARIEDSWRRIAKALASVEPTDPQHWEQQFYQALEGFRFLPGGRIQAGAGTGRRVTLCNCFVMGAIEDSMDGIFEALKQGALTMQQGGGVGYDFSTLRPRGTPAGSVGTVASGPVSFMQIWDAMCATLLSTGARRGAMMATLRCDHPDIEDFIEAKRDPHRLRHFNLSVLASDAFMAAVERDADWELVFPVDSAAAGSDEVVLRRWSGSAAPAPCRVHRRVRARELWERLMRATYDCAEPGVLFIDRINAMNNLYYREKIAATNPCGEVPLPPYGACDLGSVNLTAFVRDPFTPGARIDLEAVKATAATATRMLDNVIDVSRYPLAAQAGQARGCRRVGLGLTGLGDALIMLGLNYGEPPAREAAAAAMRVICESAYRTSIALAREKQPFPFLDRDAYLQAPFVQALPADIRDGIHQHGLRNSHLTAIAPAGTISLLANNISSGLEPVYAWRHTRRILGPDGSHAEHLLTDLAWRHWHARHGDAPLPPAFVTADELPPDSQLAMQASLQPHVDSSISKTINVPADMPFALFKDIYRQAYELGLKGCTTFRPNPVTGAVLTAGEPDVGMARHCCDVEREAD